MRNCKLNALNCVRCMIEHHAAHSKFMIEAKHIMEQRVDLLHNWYKQPIISEIAFLAYLTRKEQTDQWKDKKIAQIEKRFDFFREALVKKTDVIKKSLIQ